MQLVYEDCGSVFKKTWWKNNAVVPDDQVLEARRGEGRSRRGEVSELRTLDELCVLS